MHGYFGFGFGFYGFFFFFCIKSFLKCTCLAVISNSQAGKRKTQEDEPSALSHFTLDYSCSRTGGLGLVHCSGPVQGICHRAISILHSEAKYCRVENPVWRTWDARLNLRLDNACHHPYMQLYYSSHVRCIKGGNLYVDVYLEMCIQRFMITWIWELKRKFHTYVLACFIYEAQGPLSHLPTSHGATSSTSTDLALRLFCIAPVCFSPCLFFVCFEAML